MTPEHDVLTSREHVLFRMGEIFARIAFQREKNAKTMTGMSKGGKRASYPPYSAKKRHVRKQGAPRVMARPKLERCPVCGRKLPYDKKATENHRGNHERNRVCPCGFHQKEELIVTRYYPESHVCDEPKHPGEGGYGFMRDTRSHGC